MRSMCHRSLAPKIRAVRISCDTIKYNSKKHRGARLQGQAVVLNWKWLRKSESPVYCNPLNFCDFKCIVFCEVEPSPQTVLQIFVHKNYFTQTWEIFFVRGNFQLRNNATARQCSRATMQKLKNAKNLPGYSRAHVCFTWERSGNHSCSDRHIDKPITATNTVELQDDNMLRRKAKAYRVGEGMTPWCYHRLPVYTLA